MSLDDWILALHVLSAFALVGAMVLFWILVFAIRRSDRADVTAAMMPIAFTGNVAVIIGTVGTLVFGVWLAISLDGYQLWDDWVIAGLVLWAVGAETGRRGGEEYNRAGQRAEELVAASEPGPNAELAALNRTSTGLWLQCASSLAILLVLIDMIWKPRA